VSGAPVVVTFGEAMLRLTPASGQRLRNAHTLSLHVGGAEANVAAGLSSLGVQARWFSRLPNGELGQRVLGELAADGVDTSFVARTEGRLGTYYLEEGSGPRPAEVTYDRAGSTFALMEVAEVERALSAGLLTNAAAVVTSGITLALGPAPRVAAGALFDAAGQSLRVIDLNYRRNLATPTEMVEVAAQFLAQADLVFGAERDVSLLYGGPAGLRVAAPNAELVITQGAAGASAYLVGADPASAEPITRAALPVGTDGRIGRGDAFVAGYLAKVIERPGAVADSTAATAPATDAATDAGMDVATDAAAARAALDWGVACASLKSTWPGDLPVLSAQAVEALLAGGTSDVNR